MGSIDGYVFTTYKTIAGHKETFIVVCQTIMQCLNSELYLLLLNHADT